MQINERFVQAAVTAVFVRHEMLHAIPLELKLEYQLDAEVAINAALAAGLREQIRAEAIREAAREAKAAWLSCPYGEIADADAMCALSEYAEQKILALLDKPAPDVGQPAQKGDAP
jgi:hypothetical protein